MSDNIVMYDSDEAAQYRTGLSGWVSRDGHFFGDGPQAEEAARYDGCTHRTCEQCGEPSRKGFTWCEACREKRDIERYAAMPRAAWDGVAMIYSEWADCYFDSPWEAEEYLGVLDSPATVGDLRLVICEPVYCPELSLDDFHDDLPEDGDPPDELVAAIEAFNAATRGLLMSWRPGSFALDLGDSPATGGVGNGQD